MLVVIVQYTVRPGTEEQTLDSMRKMEEHTRREPGCRLYIGHQSIDNPRQFCFYAQYEDQEALDAHRATPYFAEYLTNGLFKLIENRSLALYRTISLIEK